MCVFDPIAGGDALLVLEIDSEVHAMAVFKESATGAPRLACGCYGEVRVFDAVSGGDALLVIEAGSSWVKALVAFEDLATNSLQAN